VLHDTGEQGLLCHEEAKKNRAFTMSEFEIGNTVGPYRIDAVLGTGGMAKVYEVFDLEKERHVALKVLLGDRALTEERKKRFLQEFEILSNVEHPGIVQVFERQEAESGIPFFTMEKIQGKSLAAVLENSSKPVFGSLELLLILKEIASALRCVHDRGYVYRDLKPGNIILQDAPDSEDTRHIKLIDFGLAISLKGEEAKGNLMPGTPWYMSPEQLRGIHIDERSDMYSFGVLAYELMSGQVPYPGESENAVMSFHMIGKVPPLKLLNDDLPSSVKYIPLMCLEKKPRDRFQSMSQVIERLEGALRKLEKQRQGGGFGGLIKKLLGKGQ
jgi:serine/threonine protein kinase